MERASKDIDRQFQKSRVVYPQDIGVNYCARKVAITCRSREILSKSKRDIWHFPRGKARLCLPPPSKPLRVSSFMLMANTPLISLVEFSSKVLSVLLIILYQNNEGIEIDALIFRASLKAIVYNLISLLNIRY